MGQKQNQKELTLYDKMKIVLEAVREIEAAPNESEAIQVAMIYLEQLRYPHAMVSWLKTIEGENYVVADPELATGDKWKEIARRTKRRFDEPVDLLPLVLKRKKARFILDSRVDPENDKDLCREMGVISHYAMPLATDSILIGTLQVDMGKCDKEPTKECEILDAFASHLSLTIERHRVLQQLETVNNDLMNQTRIITFEVAAAKIIHELNNSIGNYGDLLQEKLRNPEVRSNKAAMDFLKYTQKQITRWIQSVQENVNAVRRHDEVGNYKVEGIVKQVVANFQHKAHIQHRKLRGVYKAPDAIVSIRLGSLLELLSCLITNSFEANARNIDVIVTKITRTTWGSSKKYAEVRVSDDGHGIPEEFKSKIHTFGWSSKGEGGHGMGLTIVDLLAKSMNGEVEIVSCGKSSGEAKTEFVVRIHLFSG